MKIVEVGPRDGLQNEVKPIAPQVKIELIDRLGAAGLTVIEATSFVDPKWVPQLADADEVMAGIERRDGVAYPVLVPNGSGLDRALAAGVTDIAIFASATETFSRRNLNRSRAEALDMLAPVAARAVDAGLGLRGYLSMVLGDPWEGAVPPDEVANQARKLVDLGCTEIALGDTIGVGTPKGVRDLLSAVAAAGIDVSAIAVHFHDTYGQGLANVLTAMELGVETVDSSVGGLGGCPYAKSATGNLATEDLVWMLEGMGIDTGVDVQALADTAAWISGHLGIEIPGRVARALAS